MASSWGKRRQSLYLSVAGVIVLLALLYIYSAFFTTVPTCFDRVQNGNERGVDCGGSCALICQSDAKAPKVLWSRVFETSPGYYTAAAYIQNDNIGAGAKSVGYSFQIFDSRNQLIIERDGVVDLQPAQTVPIIEPNIPIHNQTPARVLFGFAAPPEWQYVQAGSLPRLSVKGQDLAPDGSRLSATVTNDSLLDAPSATVSAVLFDASGTARAASKSTISVREKSSVPVVFTWPGGVTDIVRAEITVLPAL